MGVDKDRHAFVKYTFNPIKPGGGRNPPTAIFPALPC